MCVCVFVPVQKNNLQLATLEGKKAGTLFVHVERKEGDERRELNSFDDSDRGSVKLRNRSSDYNPFNVVDQKW
jgi:hypothetical protein